MGYMILNRTIPGEKKSDFEPLTDCRLHQMESWTRNTTGKTCKPSDTVSWPPGFTRTPLILPPDCNPWTTQTFASGESRAQGSSSSLSALVRELGLGTWQLAVGLFRFVRWPHRAGSCAGCGHKQTVRLSIVAPPSMGFLRPDRLFVFLICVSTPGSGRSHACMLEAHGSPVPKRVSSTHLDSGFCRPPFQTSPYHLMTFFISERTTHQRHR
jgi:hypothetical protein